nr:MAG TPA: hypothetical protein [Crassvirales sp.]
MYIANIRRLVNSYKKWTTKLLLNCPFIIRFIMSKLTNILVSYLLIRYT